ncbi:MAG: hypothetical protein KKB50_16235 [Planctomycetes bacterium]|nr:hypothetical protein [Planctomycetota bacterium]
MCGPSAIGAGGSDAWNAGRTDAQQKHAIRQLKRMARVPADQCRSVGPRAFPGARRKEDAMDWVNWLIDLIRSIINLILSYF